MEHMLTKYVDAIKSMQTIKCYGKVKKVLGLVVESLGPQARLGDFCKILSDDKEILAEVVSFKENRIVLMPYGALDGIQVNSRVKSEGIPMSIPVSEELLGRVLDGCGNPIDGKKRVLAQQYYPIYRPSLHPLKRKKIDTPIATGVKSIDTFLTVGQGQRMGIFSGTGVGKSTLLASIARNSDADVHVIALVGERSREVLDFIEQNLNDNGMKRSVLVVATSDSPPMLRISAGYVATTIAEFFRDCGYRVILMMDSLTRLARAQREIGLAIGEPPATRGYPPSVYSLIPRLIERTGNFKNGSITGFYTILVEGDDFNEPISDNAMAILDGHIILSRQLAQKNHYPAIDVLGSVSRLANELISDKLKLDVSKLRRLMAAYRDVEELIQVGAYVKGSNVMADEAVAKIDEINCFLRQELNQKFELEESFQFLRTILNSNESQNS